MVPDTALPHPPRNNDRAANTATSAKTRLKTDPVLMFIDLSIAVDV
jgi:hypothetical protein